MAISVFNLFSIGIGPSSSHTVGPMRAARQFVLKLEGLSELENITRLKVDLYGSLALTGKGHGTDFAILLGLQGETPEGVDPHSLLHLIAYIRETHTLRLNARHSISFNEKEDLLFHKEKQLPFHPNGMRFTAYDHTQKEILSEVYYSVGGGFIIDHDSANKKVHLGDDAHTLPYIFHNADTLLHLCRQNHLSIAQLMLENEKTWRNREEIVGGLLNVWDIMRKCIEAGCKKEGELPGGLGVKRRAGVLLHSLEQRQHEGKHSAAEVMEWVSLWALAVNEENAAGGRVVTAPTNGAAGIIPSVLNYYNRMTSSPTEEGIVTFLLTAGAIGILYKLGASISAAEMGCMGEVGVACSMAAAGLTAALGGTSEQIENAAEIGMEHNLGLTCDPIMGLVQIPCIERNAMGAVKAINAASLALQGDGSHRVSLDQVIATMRQTGKDMKSIYKETSLGGLAVNVPEC